VNLIGEHTDYNGGFVLPMAIPQRTWIALARRPDGTARVASRDVGASGRVRTFEVGREVRVTGVARLRAGMHAGPRPDGHTLGGFDAAWSRPSRSGSGLSSSAALEVAVLRGLREIFSLTSTT
jgi:galactokinase